MRYILPLALLLFTAPVFGQQFYYAQPQYVVPVQPVAPVQVVPIQPVQVVPVQPVVPMVRIVQRRRCWLVGAIFGPRHVGWGVLAVPQQPRQQAK